MKPGQSISCAFCGARGKILNADHLRLGAVEIEWQLVTTIEREYREKPGAIGARAIGARYQDPPLCPPCHDARRAAS